MATELSPAQGLQQVATVALSGATVYWFLVFGQTVAGATITSSSTLAGLQEETGTGYARSAVTVGVAVNGIMSVPGTSFTNGSNLNWHTNVSACGIATLASGGVAIYVWDLGGGSVNMQALANNTLLIPSVNIFVENPGGI